MNGRGEDAHINCVVSRVAIVPEKVSMNTAISEERGF